MPRTVDEFGKPVSVFTASLVRKPVQTREVQRGESWFTLESGNYRFRFMVCPWTAAYCLGCSYRDGRRWVRLDYVSLPINEAKMRRLTSAAGDAPRPKLSGESAIFRKLPLISEFVSLTTYEDGTPRLPGYVTLRNRGHCYELTGYDYDSGQRLVVGALTLDEVWAALNGNLGADLAPWVPDDYLTGLLTKKKKK